jgi:exopolyphosphatase/guanosine-5'-triphosphate,3'-diphosphate pyrophosphatase
VKRYASIDIGSNTILLLIGEVNVDGMLKISHDIAETTRLGRGLSKGKLLHPESVLASIVTLKKYVSLCYKEGVEEIAAVGTSALRLARDADQFIKRVTNECSIIPRVINEKEEALLTNLSVQRDRRMPHDAIVIDAGGGSTEYILNDTGNNCSTDNVLSLPLGAVSLTEKFVRHDPPTRNELVKLKREIDDQLKHILVTGKRTMVGIGGTATTIAAINLGLNKFDRTKIHGYQLAIDELGSIVKKLQALDIESKKKVSGLPPDRADIIMAGAMIILASMEKIESPIVYISCYGLRYGLLYRMAM